MKIIDTKSGEVVAEVLCDRPDRDLWYAVTNSGCIYNGDHIITNGKRHEYADLTVEKDLTPVTVFTKTIELPKLPFFRGNNSHIRMYAAKPDGEYGTITMTAEEYAFGLARGTIR